MGAGGTWRLRCHFRRERAEFMASAIASAVGVNGRHKHSERGLRQP